MADVWFRKLGFSRNPFNIKPAAFSYELFGISLDGVLSGIEEGKVLFVEAPLGYGKTTMLKGIIHRFGGRKKVIYANALPSEKVDVKDLLKRSSLVNYITGSLPTGMILVVDEAQNLTSGNSAEVFEFYRSGNVRAVVFFGTRYSRTSFVEGLNSVMNGNVIHLSSPTPEQAISLVRGRIGNLPLLSDDTIRAAYRRAKGNPRRLLQICDDLCRYASELGKLPAQEMEPPATAAEATGATETAEAEQPAASAASATAAIAVVPAKRRGRAKAASAASGRKPKQQKNKQKNKRQRQSKGKSPPKLSKPLKSLKSSKTSTHAATIKSTVTNYQQPESTEGSYWGEFMGMQK
ncbi:hypothetical protein HYV83_01315 [Candidatus Woesearchaeota archaeon]|nr:hypothetical protein [Candidatus Woesearchaeota archaeon]